MQWMWWVMMMVRWIAWLLAPCTHVANCRLVNAIGCFSLETMLGMTYRDRLCICNWTSPVNQSLPVAVLMLLCAIQKCSNHRGMRRVVGQGGDHQMSLGKLHGKSMRYPREYLSFQLPWDMTISWACTLVGISLRENDFAFTSELIPQSTRSLLRLSAGEK